MDQRIDIDEILPAYEDQGSKGEKGQYYNDDVKKILEAWLNERYSPELLNYQDELISNLIEMLEAQAENVALLRGTDSEDQVSIILYEQEMERIKYVLQSYLRTRLSKIQEYASYFLKSDVYRARMSAAELIFAEGFDALLEFNFRESFLDRLPAYMQSSEDTTDTHIVRKPDLGKAVICRVKEEIGEVYISERESVIMKSGDIYILPYDAIRSALEKGMVELI